MMDNSLSTTPVVEVPRARPLPVLVLADVSGSMGQDGKITVLNTSVATMIRNFAAEDTLHTEITVGVITFGYPCARLHHPVVPATEARWSDMTANGPTPLGQAFDLARDVLEDELIIPKAAYEPTLVLVSDGIPTDNWQDPLRRLLASPRGGKALRLAVAVGAEMGTNEYRVLEEFVANPAYPVVRAEEIDRLSQFFDRVTVTVTTRVRSRNPDDLSSFDPDELYELTD